MPLEGDQNHNKALITRDTTDTLRGVPALISGAGYGASKRFLEFFTANIRNRNTRFAYARAVGDFFAWCEHRGGQFKIRRITYVNCSAA
jgi:hypothetical protein